MTQLTFSIPNGIAERVVDGFVHQHGYKDTVPNPQTRQEFVDAGGNAPDYTAEIPNPVTKQDFARSEIIQFVKDSVTAWESSQAAEQARITASADAETLTVT